MVRVGYDAESRQYTFLDTTSGVYFVSAPGEAFGTLVPAATASFPTVSRSTGRRRTLQAYDRPVIFADDIDRRARSSSPRSESPSPPPSRGSTTSPSSPHGRSSSNRRGHKRSASFSDILPPHLIARASGKSPVDPAEPSAKAPASAGGRPRSALLPSPTSPFEDEKKHPPWSPTELGLPSLPSLPPPLPPKDSPVSADQQPQQAGGMSSPRVALRLTARMVGRTLEAVKGVHRSREGEGQSKDGGWVVV
jgi:hypothetical protein